MSFSQHFTERPAILQDPNDLEVVFGTSAIFKCKAEGDPVPDIKWMRNSNEIDSSDSRIRVQVDGTLQIDRIDERDQGVYVSKGMARIRDVEYLTIHSGH